MSKVKSKRKSVFYFMIRLIILLVTVFFLFTIIDINEVSIIYKEGFALWLLAVVLFIAVFRVFLNSVRWKMLNINNSSLKLGGYFKYMMISHIYNLFLPGVLGGDFARAVIVSADNKNDRTSNVMSIFYDRIVGMISIVLLAILAFIFSEFISSQQKYFLGISFILIIFVAFFLMHKVSKKNTEYIQKISEWKDKHLIKYIKKIANDIVVFIASMYAKPMIFVKTFVISLIIHVIWFFANYMIFKSFDVHISFYDVSLVTSIVWGITVLPISISGIGVREITYIGLLANYGVSKETATTVSIYIFSISILVAILALPLLLLKKKN
jgi:glycosyltransferase 2 family protein